MFVTLFIDAMFQLRMMRMKGIEDSTQLPPSINMTSIKSNFGTLKKHTSIINNGAVCAIYKFQN